MGSATVSFGLVAIPVKLYPASQSGSGGGISFNLLHAKCGSRLKQQYMCTSENVPVERADMVKGYEFQKGKYVTFTEDELEKLKAAKTETVEITEFVPVEKVDAVYYDKPYYLGPDKGGEKPYRLLAEAMVRTGRVAIAKYAARGQGYLVMVRPAEGGRGLVMQQLRYADEVRPFSEVPDVSDAELKDAELTLAVKLVEQISTDAFSPENYEDEVKKRTEALIASKVAGQEIAEAPPEAPRQVVDLMEALKASLAAAGSDDAKSDARKPPKRAEPRQAEKAPAKAKKVS